MRVALLKGIGDKRGNTVVVKNPSMPSKTPFKDSAINLAERIIDASKQSSSETMPLSSLMDGGARSNNIILAHKHSLSKVSHQEL